MDDDEIIAYIEQKNGKKMGYSKPDVRFSNSGDDSVLIDSGRYTTMEDVNKTMDEIIKHHRSKKKPKSVTIEDEEILGK